MMTCNSRIVNRSRERNEAKRDLDSFPEVCLPSADA
jgi:hypothetical protein